MASFSARDADHVITYEYCNYAAVLEKRRNIFARIRLNFDDLRGPVVINPGVLS
jgi:hypothetical protein